MAVFPILSQDYYTRLTLLCRISGVLIMNCELLLIVTSLNLYLDNDMVKKESCLK